MLSVSHPSATSTELLARADGTLYVREAGRTSPASPAQVEARFGAPILEAVRDLPGRWLAIEDVADTSDTSKAALADILAEQLAGAWEWVYTYTVDSVDQPGRGRHSLWLAHESWDRQPDPQCQRGTLYVSGQPSRTALIAAALAAVRQWHERQPAELPATSHPGWDRLLAAVGA